MSNVYQVAKNIKFVRDNFHFTYEDLALKTTVGEERIKNLEEAKEDEIFVQDNNSVAVCFICNYLTIPAEDFYLKDISKDIYTAEVFIKLLEEHKTGLKYDRSHFYSSVIDKYREIQKNRTSIKPSSIIEGLIAQQVLLIHEIQQIENKNV